MAPLSLSRCIAGKHSTRKRFALSLIAALSIALAFSVALSAQTASQHPALSQPANAKPDLSGVWKMPIEAFGHYDLSFGAADLPMTPWAQEMFDAAKPSEGPRSVITSDLNDPFYKCFPPGIPRIYLHPFAMEIVQTPKQMLQLFEYDHLVRHIFTDGRPHPEDPDPTWMGHAIGHWEGDTFVTDTIGFNDKTWIDRVGHPHSEQLHVTERFRRVNPTTLQLEIALEDPVAYTRPIKKRYTLTLQPKWDILEHVCVDNAAFLDFDKKESQPPK